MVSECGESLYPVCKSVNELKLPQVPDVSVAEARCIFPVAFARPELASVPVVYVTGTLAVVKYPLV